MQAIATKRNQCTATRKDGQPCRAPALPGGAFCFAHDPDLASHRAEARQRGGQNRARTVRFDKLVPATLRPVLQTLLTALDATYAGDLDPRVATALASLAGAIVKTYQIGQLEERLTALEALAVGSDAEAQRWA